MAQLWAELLTRINYLRDLYRQKRILLKPGEGIAWVLDEAEAVAKAEVSPKPPSTENVMEAVKACHVAWNLYEVIKDCIDAGLDVSNHLGEITAGTIDYGTPANAIDRRTIFFKDFEAELLVAALLARAKLPVQFLKEANDPCGEMRVDNIFVEVKHPNSPGGIERLMRKFHGELRKRNAVGVFVTAVEDAFRLGDKETFDAPEQFQTFNKSKLDEIEKFGREAVRRAAALPAIACLAQISSRIAAVAGETRFIRLGNSIVYDDRRISTELKQQVEQIAAVFNPQFRHYSQIRDLITSDEST